MPSALHGRCAVRKMSLKTMSAATMSRLLSDAQVKSLFKILNEGAYQPRQIPYARYSYSRPGLMITVYEKGNKLLVQGKSDAVQEWIEFVLEPQVLKQALCPELPLEKTPFVASKQNLVAHFGIDESGKGDYFGPLTIAGVYADSEITRRLEGLGVCDSKLIKSLDRIRKLANGIRQIPGIKTAVVSVGPERYNQLYKQFGNLNSFLAWGHVRVIASLLEQQPDCPRALSDQFAHPTVLKRALAQRGLNILLDQRTKAESDLAVAAASILARERFVNWMEQAAIAGKVELPLGASRHVIVAAKKLVEIYGEEMLPKVAKMHFKTTASVLPHWGKDVEK